MSTTGLITPPRCPHCDIPMYTMDGVTYTCPNCYNTITYTLDRGVTGIAFASASTSITVIPEPKIDKDSRFYKNCKSQRKRGAKICGECPFRQIIEKQEMKWLLGL